MDDCLRHPFTLAVASALLGAVLIVVVQRLNERRTSTRKMGDVVRDLDTYVVPWFRTPAPGEEDVTLPAEVRKIKADIAPTNGDRSSISDRVDKARKTGEAVHAELDAYKAEQASERAERQAALDEQLAAGTGRFDDLERGQAEIKKTLDLVCANLPELLAGNPEIHQRGRI